MVSPDRHWQFHCPECGFGSVELRYRAADHEIHCEVCLDEQGRFVLLRRWLTEETPPPAEASRAPPASPLKKNRAR